MKERTRLGKFLAKVRIDNGENKVKMCDRIKIGTHLLDSVESGIRETSAPRIIGKILKYYIFHSILQDELVESIVEEKYGITIDTSELSKEDTKNLLIFLNVLHGHTISKVDQRRLYVWLESKGFPCHD